MEQLWTQGAGGQLTSVTPEGCSISIVAILREASASTLTCYWEGKLS